MGVTAGSGCWDPGYTRVMAGKEQQVWQGWSPRIVTCLSDRVFAPAHMGGPHRHSADGSWLTYYHPGMASWRSTATPPLRSCTLAPINTGAPLCAEYDIKMLERMLRSTQSLQNYYEQNMPAFISPGSSPRVYTIYHLTFMEWVETRDAGCH